MSDTDALWDQQPDETAPAFKAFTAYLDLVPYPSIRALAKNLDISRSQLEKWSKAYRWEKRVRAYMRSQDRANRATQYDDRKKMSAKHIAISQALIAKGLERLTQMHAAELKPSEAARLVHLGVELEVKARSYATDTLESLAEPILELAGPVAEVKDLPEAKPPTLQLYSFDDELAGNG